MKPLILFVDLLVALAVFVSFCFLAAAVYKSFVKKNKK